MAFTETGGQLVDWLKGRFGALAGFVSETFDGIAAAMASGNIELAAKILWASLRVLFRQGVNWIREPFDTVTMHMVKAWAWIVGKFRLAWTNFSHFWRKTWTELSSFAGNVWDDLIDLLQ